MSDVNVPKGQVQMQIRDWNQLKTVAALKEHGTYKKAGRATGMSCTTIARHINQLEKDLSVALFVQHNGSWVPTELGLHLGKLGHETRDELNAILAGNGQLKEKVGDLNITTISFIADHFLSNRASNWRHRHPMSTLTIEASDTTVGIGLGEADVALRLARPQTDRARRFKLAVSPVGIFAPTTSESNDWIGLPHELDGIPEMKMAREFFGRPPILRMNSYAAVAEAALSTAIPAILPTCISKTYPTLKRLESKSKASVAVRELWFVYHERRSDDPTILAAISWVKSIFPSPNRCLCGECSASVVSHA